MTSGNGNPGAAPGVTDLSAALRRWLGAGGCQGPEGAFHAWRDEASGELAFAYPEITGYALTHLCGAGAPIDGEREAAERAAGWLLDRLVGRGDYSARADWDSGAVYNFDLAMIATGLANAGHALGDERCMDAAVQVVRYLADQIGPGGVVPAVADDGGDSARSGWSVDGEVHMLKALQCFLLAERAGDDALAGPADAMAAAAARLQQDDGRFPTQLGDDHTMLHPHLYAAEGLWAYGTARGDAAVLDVARRASEWAWDRQLDTGGFPRYAWVGTDGDPAPEQFDVTSQALRMAALFGLDSDRQAAARERLGEVARPAGGSAAALPYQAPPAPAHHNAWVSMFGTQALAVSLGEIELTWEALV